MKLGREVLSQIQKFGIKPSLVVNREFMVDQRNEGASVRADTFGITFDQWFFADAGGVNGANAQHIASDIPGFARILRITSTGSTSLTGSCFFGQDLLPRVDLSSGTPSAVPLYAKIVARCSHDAVLPFQFASFENPPLLSFWHLLSLKAGVVTTFDVAIPGNTASDINSGGGMDLVIWLRPHAPDPNGDAILDTWSGAAYGAAKFTRQTDFTALTGATLDFAYIDLRPSSTALPIIHDTFEQHLFECQYFFQKLGYIVGSPANNFIGGAPGSAVTNGTIGYIVSATQSFSPSLAGVQVSRLRGMWTTPTLTIYDGLGAAGKLDFYDATMAQWNNGGSPGPIQGGGGDAPFSVAGPTNAGGGTAVAVALNATFDALF